MKEKEENKEEEKNDKDEQDDKEEKNDKGGYNPHSLWDQKSTLSFIESGISKEYSF